MLAVRYWTDVSDAPVMDPTVYEIKPVQVKLIASVNTSVRSDRRDLSAGFQSGSPAKIYILLRCYVSSPSGGPRITMLNGAIRMHVVTMLSDNLERST